MPSITVENYLKQLYMEQLRAGDGLVPMGRLAQLMKVVPGTATTMVKALADSGLVSYEPRGGVRLTTGGEKLASHVLRRHRLVELFLMKVLGLDLAEVHEEAEELEHAISDKVMERIDSFLGRPATDPHGDPIPTSTGEVQPTPAMDLADCPLDIPLTVARVMDQSPAFLQFIERSGLAPGAAIVVHHRDEAADAIAITVAGHNLTLGTTAAQKIRVQPAESSSALNPR